MYTANRLSKSVALKLVALALLSALARPSLAEPRTDAIRVAVYRGPAACENCPETLKAAIERLSTRYGGDFVGPVERIDSNAGDSSRCVVHAEQDGGNANTHGVASFGDGRIDAIHDYVAHGGRYLGICMGAYLASASGLGLIPHELDSEVGRRDFPVTTIDSAVVAVRWKGKEETVFYQDGPYLLRSADDRGFAIIATYANNDIAAARYTLGRGLVVLSGPHPEADESWFEEAGLPADHMPGDHLLRSLLAGLER